MCRVLGSIFCFFELRLKIAEGCVLVSALERAPRDTSTSLVLCLELVAVWLMRLGWFPRGFCS